MPTSKVSFDRKESVPDESTLKEALGAVYPAYTELVTLIGTYQREWKFYGAKIGWQFKVTHKGKALFYMTPQKSSFRLAFAVCDKEKEALLDSNLPAKTKEELATAKKSPEGFPLRLQVNKKSDMKCVRLVIESLKALRLS